MLLRRLEHSLRNLFNYFFRTLLVSRVRNTLKNALDLSEDEIGICRPEEGFGVVIPLVQVFEHGFFQCSHSGMASTTDASVGHFGKESLDQVEPTGAGGGKVNVIARVAR